MRNNMLFVKYSIAKKKKKYYFGQTESSCRSSAFFVCYLKYIYIYRYICIIYFKLDTYVSKYLNRIKKIKEWKLLLDDFFVIQLFNLF